MHWHHCSHINCSILSSYFCSNSFVFHFVMLLGHVVLSIVRLRCSLLSLMFCGLCVCWTHWCSDLFFSRPRSEGWAHHGRTFSIYLCPLSFWLTLPRRVLSTSWCCPSRPCVAFLAFVHLALFLALSLSPGNSLVSSWCDHSMLASLLWRCLTDPSSLQLCWALQKRMNRSSCRFGYGLEWAQGITC